VKAWHVVLVLGAVVVAACVGVLLTIRGVYGSPGPAYLAMLQQAEASSEINDFVMWFPTAETAIQHSTGEAGPPSWWGELRTDGVLIEASANLRRDPKSGKVSQAGGMTVLVLAIEQREQLPDGRTSESYRGQCRLSHAELAVVMQQFPAQKMAIAELERRARTAGMDNVPTADDLELIREIESRP
jgi:hypothetical protein